MANIGNNGGGPRRNLNAQFAGQQAIVAGQQHQRLANGVIRDREVNRVINGAVGNFLGNQQQQPAVEGQLDQARQLVQHGAGPEFPERLRQFMQGQQRQVAAQPPVARQAPPIDANALADLHRRANIVARNQARGGNGADNSAMSTDTIMNQNNH